MVNLELYRVFYTVAKCGSLTKAAQELYISQPAVSQAIKQLEEQLGVRLFNRTHRGMELSAQGGKAIFAQVEHALGLLNDAENHLSEMSKSATGTIRIGASDTIFEYFLADKIVGFHERFPAVKIELLAGYSPYTIENLKANKCDVAFVHLPIAEDPELQLYGNCMRLNDIFVASSKYQELTENIVPLRKLRNYPLIAMNPDTVARRSVDNFFQSHGVELSPSIEVGSWDLMKRLVVSGMGLGIIPREYVEDNLADGTLYEIETDPQLPARSIGMLLPKNTSTSYALHCFLESIYQD